MYVPPAVLVLPVDIGKSNNRREGHIHGEHRHSGDFGQHCRPLQQRHAVSGSCRPCSRGRKRCDYDWLKTSGPKSYKANIRNFDRCLPSEKGAQQGKHFFGCGVTSPLTPWTDFSSATVSASLVRFRKIMRSLDAVYEAIQVG